MRPDKNMLRATQMGGGGSKIVVVCKGTAAGTKVTLKKQFKKRNLLHLTINCGGQTGIDRMGLEMAR
jgi:GT2 family glycosyltransferase